MSEELTHWFDFLQVKQVPICIPSRVRDKCVLMLLFCLGKHTSARTEVWALRLQVLHVLM